MNAQEKEDLSRSLLRFLDENRTRYGLPTGYLVAKARPEGRPDLTKAEVEAQLEYLEGKGLVGEVLKGIHPENRAWRITAAGIDFVACGSS